MALKSSALATEVADRGFSLVLPETDPQELTDRLRVWVAHLLGRDRSRRAALSSTIRDLYKIRSKIVHSGSYQVTDEELGQLPTLSAGGRGPSLPRRRYHYYYGFGQRLAGHQGWPRR